MACWTWRGVLGSIVAALLLVAPTSMTLAQTSTPVAKAATKPEKPVAITKPAAVKTAAKKPEATHPAKKLAAAKAKPPIKKLAIAPKKPAPTKKVAAAKKPAAPTKLAAVAPKSVPPSYTITTSRDGITHTTTRIVPLSAFPAPTPAASAPAETKIAVMPVSLTEPAKTASPVEKTLPPPEKPAASAPENTPSPASPAQMANPGAAASFVTNFLKEAFHIAKLDGATSLQRRAQLADLFAGKMDVKRIAGYTTADELTEMSSDIQQRFRTILVSYLVETYYPRLELASDPSVRVETTPGETLADGTAVVWTTFTKDGWGSQSVKWHLAAESGGYKIVDIFSAGASLVQMERDTFLSVMRNGGLTQLMAKLDARTKELATAATE